MNQNIALGQRIKNIRKNSGLTQEDFGEKFGASKGNVSMWESGKVEPSPERLKAIADFGGLSVNELYTGDNSQQIFEVIYEYAKKVNMPINDSALNETVSLLNNVSFNSKVVVGIYINKLREKANGDLTINISYFDFYNFLIKISNLWKKLPPSQSEELLDSLQTLNLKIDEHLLKKITEENTNNQRDEKNKTFQAIIQFIHDVLE